LNVGPGVRVSVNLSCRQFNQPDLFERIMGILAETGLSPERLSLEVTEGVLMENVDNAVLLLNRLRAKNIGLQLDDFGTGYSSLSYLRRLPFDGLKIDKSFVHEMGLRQENVEIVGTIALLARTLGMTVLAEGVETHEQIQMLIGAGCDYAQGNLFSVAVDSEAARAFFGGFRHILSQTSRQENDTRVSAVV
jgi:EAL domain-containing protein (putative c-di-GMP-specific phosphodiesterase class I)